MASLSALPSILATPTSSSFTGFDDDDDFDDNFYTPRATATSFADSNGVDTVNDNIETVEQKRETAVYNYYFLILVAGVMIFIGLMICMRRRKNQRKTNAAFLGRNALARDLESWHPSASQAHEPPTTARRWMNRLGARTGRSTDDDQHGLNELGEAPPPYKAREAALERGNDIPADMPAVPLATLSRSAIGKPPGYDESVSRVSLATSVTSISNNPTRPVSSLRATSTTQLVTQDSTLTGDTPATQTLQPPQVRSAP